MARRRMYGSATCRMSMAVCTRVGTPASRARPGARASCDRREHAMRRSARSMPWLAPLSRGRCSRRRRRCRPHAEPVHVRELGGRAQHLRSMPKPPVVPQSASPLSLSTMRLYFSEGAVRRGYRAASLGPAMGPLHSGRGARSARAAAARLSRTGRRVAGTGPCGCCRRRRALSPARRGRCKGASVPSEIHELLVEVFRSRPEVVVRLARALSLVPLSGRERARAVGEGVSASVTDFRPDCVVELRDEAGRVVRTVVVEVQLRRDVSKGFSLPVYQALLRARHRCPCDVMVVTPVAYVAESMRAPIRLGERSSVGALVVGPDDLARLGRAADDPAELLFLRAVATVERDPRVLLEAPAIRAVGRADRGATLTTSCRKSPGPSVRRSASSWSERCWISPPTSSRATLPRPHRALEGRGRGRWP